MENFSGKDQNLYLLGKLSNFIQRDDLLQFLGEISKHDFLISKIEKNITNVKSFKTKKFKVYDFRFFRIALYCIVRSLKPKIIVETGIMHGLSSSFFLAALRKNNQGRLISVDLPSYFESGPVNQDGYNYTLPPNKEPGWIIPTNLKKYWMLEIGSSKMVFPKITKKFKKWDLFCHDSEHTYKNMKFELRFAWKHLRKNGILICDNIEANNAFEEFCFSVKRKPLLLETPNRDFSTLKRFGIIIK